jgi:hypothetical protein
MERLPDVKVAHCFYWQADKNESAGIQHTTLNLISLYAFEQRFEIPFPKSIIAFALNEFKENGSDNGF